MNKPVSQEVQAPFCLVPMCYVSNPTAIRPVDVVLTIAGLAISAFGIWDLIQMLPDYSVPTVIILFGTAILWIGVAPILRRLRTSAADVGCWIGCDSGRFILAMHDQFYSKAWTELGKFQVYEHTTNEFVTKYKGQGLDDEVNFVQTTLMTLYANTLDGPPIEIPFEHFTHAERDRRAAADNLCVFLNDVRHRALNGGLERGASPFFAPAELRIIPLRELPSGRASPTNSKLGPPVVQRQD